MHMKIKYIDTLKVKMKKRLFKRGISPIVATVLLIALAVSVGAVIINIGGVYIGKFGKNISCSDFEIRAFELEDDLKCKGYEFNPIVNFYRLEETIKTPECYTEVAEGDGKVCIAPDVVLDSTWTPTNKIIR